MNRFEIMSVKYRRLVRPVFFLTDEEWIHDAAVRTGEFWGGFGWGRGVTKLIFGFKSPVLEQELLGLKFENPVGLSAGFDKDGRMVEILEPLGFGFGQVGSVTMGPYGGNDPPRVTRLPRSKAIIVNYGLKSEGAKAVAARLKKKSEKKLVPVGISLAKTNSPNTVDLEAGIKDYVDCLKVFRDSGVGDFYTVNVSCPNAFGGEPFCSPDRLEELLRRIKGQGVEKPFFIKMPIDLPWPEFKQLLEVVLKKGVEGVVIGNIAKKMDDLVLKEKASSTKGGISGLPIRDRVDDLIAKTYDYCGDRLIIVGVGGIFSAEDAYEKIKRGASLVQLITGMIYEGPSLVGGINLGLERLLKADGYKNIKEAVGAYHC